MRPYFLNLDVFCEKRVLLLRSKVREKAMASDTFEFGLNFMLNLLLLLLLLLTEKGTILKYIYIFQRIREIATPNTQMGPEAKQTSQHQSGG